MPLIRPERPKLREVSPATIGIVVVLVAGLVAALGVLRSVSDHGARAVVAATATTTRSAPTTSAAAAPSTSRSSTSKATAPSSTMPAASASSAVSSPADAASAAKTTAAGTNTAAGSSAKPSTSPAARRGEIERELRRVRRDLALILRAEQALRAATRLQPSATVDAAIKQLDARAAALRNQEASLRAELRSLRPAPSTPKPTPKPSGQDRDGNNMSDHNQGRARDHRATSDPAGQRPRVTPARERRRGSAPSRGHPSVKHAAPTPSTTTRVTKISKAPTKDPKPAPVKGLRKQASACPLTSGGARGVGNATCPPVAPPPCGRPLVLMPSRCWPPCTAWWPCHQPPCGGPWQRFNAASAGNPVPSRCWPWPPCSIGGGFKARAAAQAIMCPLQPVVGAGGTTGGVLHRPASGTLKATRTVTQRRTAPVPAPGAPRHMPIARPLPAAAGA